VATWFSTTQIDGNSLSAAAAAAAAQAGLQKLADDHPDVMLHMDEGIISRISSMSQAKVRGGGTARQQCWRPA
jgi:hypothetical protein